VAARNNTPFLIHECLIQSEDDDAYGDLGFIKAAGFIDEFS
jgi:hypothetical protein